MGSPINKEIEKQLNSNYYSTEIKSIVGDKVILTYGQYVVNASVAVSCLITPMVGDQVVVWKDNNEHYIVQILKRTLQNENLRQISMPADLLISAKDKLEFQAKDETHNISKLKLNSDNVLMMVSQVQLVSETVVTQIKSLMQSMKNSIRNVSDIDTQSLGSAIKRVKKVYAIDSDRVIITAKKDVKVDAEKIHMG